MSNLIVANEIAGASVYGVRQMQYTVNGVSNQDFATALTAAAFKQSVAIEDAAGSFVSVVRKRQQKVNDLGDVLAVLAKAVASMKPKDGQSSDKSDADNALITAAEKADLYGIGIPLTDGNKITRGNALTAQNDIQYALDVEDNNLQQDTVSLQSLLTKRDNAFSNAAKIVKKSLNASAAVIGNIG
ncbi:MAG: hypothetical protein J6U40_08720 [Kiritimatiellae bacterium]|nr:hypothetical protein [Kiritimatiellia bacterium]